MRTSLIETQTIERYLLGPISNEDRLLIETKMTLNPELEEKVNLQRQVYEQVKTYGRKQLSTEIQAVHRQLFTAPQHRSFRQRVMAIFKT